MLIRLFWSTELFISSCIEVKSVSRSGEGEWREKKLEIIQIRSNHHHYQLDVGRSIF
jgi:hypothetical protein